MNHSILVVGSDAFYMMVQEILHPFTSVAASHALDCVQAGLSMQAKQPDIMVVQVQELESAVATLQLKERSRFRWIYALALLEHPSPPPTSQTQSQDPPASQDPPTDPTVLTHQQVRLLAAGADLCLAFLSLETQLPEHERKYLQAQLRVGITTVTRHRELLQTNDLLSTIALVDPLTELSNRRALDWELPRQVQRSRERQRPLSLMIFDLDFFKNINDTYGHLVGDVSLKLLSARLRHNLRSNDTLFRYGGEEFVVILSDTQAGEAGEIGQRLCQTISAQAFTINDDLELSLTVSVGVAVLRPEDDAKGLTLLERADRRLRQAKQAGRNRVVTV